jgi:CheY-like chemotaxis protein/HPt (histidine-containing phosphotransfer) domain-containing protein
MGGTIELESTVGEGSLFTLKIPVVANRECEVSKFDASIFEGIRFGLLAYDISESYKLESLQRYWDYFGLDIQIVDNVQDTCDLLIFLESSMDDTARETIIRHQIPSVAILDFLDDRYDAITTIVPLTFPIYCTKLQSALNEVLGVNTPHTATMERTQGRRGFKGKVLVAEDNLANQELIKIILERYGLEYTMASNGQEALDCYQADVFDMVLMDEQMPHMNGNEATERILAFEQARGMEHTPIAAVTANVMKGSRERSIQNGYDAFLGKPIVLKEIEQLFERYLTPVVLPFAEPTKEIASKWGNIDMHHLKSALMLEEEQIEYLLDIYLERMGQSLQELSAAIEQQDYEQIAFIAHAIKGSSANFRFDELSRLSYVIEESAVEEDEDFDFTEAYEVLRSGFRKQFE